MITVLVKFEETVETHPQLESITQIRGRVVEVEKLTEVNEKFKRIVDVKVLNTGAPVINIHNMFEKMEIHRNVTQEDVSKIKEVIIEALNNVQSKF